MPRILRHTPQWLERPAPGYKLFNDTQNDTLANGNVKHQKGRIFRIVAHRGTEVFVAVGNQLRWSDLVLLREQDYHRTHQGDGQRDEALNFDWEAYRVRIHALYNSISAHTLLGAQNPRI